MAVVCSSCPVLAHSRGRGDEKNGNATASTCSEQIACHISHLQLPGSACQALKVVWPKTTRAWGHSGDDCARRRNRPGPWGHWQWRATLGDSADNPAGGNSERTGNGAIGIMAITHEKTIDQNVEDDSAGEIAAIDNDNELLYKSVDAPPRGLADTFIGDCEAISDGCEETISLASSTTHDLSESTAPPSGKEEFPQHKEQYVSLIWEVGAEIERLTPEMASIRDEKNAEEQNLRFFVKEGQSRQEESLLGVKTSQQVSGVEAEWLNQRLATHRTIWISREDNAFDKFFQNMSKIQQKIWLMLVVHGKLAWIRLQQLLTRRLRGLQEILANFPESEDDLNVREAELLAFADKLMNQSTLHDEAHARSQEALHRGEGMVCQLNAQTGQLKEDVASRDALLRLLQKESSVSSQSLQRTVQSLSDAEKRIIDLERRVHTGEELLDNERNKTAAAMRSAGVVEQAARVAESKVAELTAEISSLKALAASGRRAEHLRAQVNALEQELKARDALLLEIRTETMQSTEALKVAAQIKQDLNVSRHREVQLTNALESANDLVKELQSELLENLRSLRAEQALKQMEKMLQDTKLEVQLLRKGIEERDKSIHVMKDEVNANIGLLSNAARDREELKKMKFQMEDLKAELESSDGKLKLMREEMASVINLARQKQSLSSGISGSTHPSMATSGSPAAVQVPKPRKKSQPRKQHGTQQSS